MSFFSSLLPRSGSTGHSPPVDLHGELPFRPSLGASHVQAPSARSDLFYERQRRGNFQRRTPDRLVAVRRRETALQDELQQLLDAQADGLLAGLSNSVTDNDRSYNGATASVRSLSGGEDARAQQERSRVAGLNEARRGIYSVMQELVEMKDDEIHFLDEDVMSNSIVLEQMETWSTKQDGLEREINKISQGDESVKAQSLKEEAARLQSEIDDLEVRLSQKKNEHRLLLAKASAMENSMQAALSSYQGSLAMLEQEIKLFLDNPPPQSSYVKEPFRFSVPPKRRTIDLAKEHWRDERKVLRNQLKQVELERNALDEGSLIWSEVVAEVTSFEDRLRAGISNLGQSSQQPQQQKGDRGLQVPSNHLEELLSRMDHTMSLLEGHLRLAETKNWRLLVCCIGAELEAFRQGRDILSGVLPTQSEPAEHSETEMQSFHGGLTLNRSDTSLPGFFSNRAADTPKDDPLDIEDDEPDPELLLSRPDSRD